MTDLDEVAVKENARRIDAALAEVGLAGRVFIESDGQRVTFHESVPDATAWRAIALSDPLPGFPCWPCLEARSPIAGRWPTCEHDWRTERWPEVAR